MKKQPKNKTETLSDRDLDRIGTLLDNAFDNRLAPLATKKDLFSTKQEMKESMESFKTELKDYVQEGVETIMDGMDKLSEQLAEKQRVDRLEQWTKQIAQKVGIKLL